MDLLLVLLSTTAWANAGGAIGAGLAAVGAGIGIGQIRLDAFSVPYCIFYSEEICMASDH